MKSPPPETRPPKLQDEKRKDATKGPSESEKDSGYSDSSSESLSSEDIPPPRSLTATPAQAAYTPIYIVLKQPRLLLLQPPLRRQRKRASPASYLPILRSYPRIAPRLPPPSPIPDLLKDTAPNPSASGESKPTAPQLLEVSLRSLALMGRTRETQRSIRELRAHARLYERALQGEEGGWERLQKAMERSGGYRKVPYTTGTDTTRDDSSTSAEEAVTSPVTSAG